MIVIKNWSRYQSYKDRKPPWIRFHRDILDDYKFQMMTSDARATLPMLWLLACEHEDPTSGIVSASLQEISFRLRQAESLLAKVFIELQGSGFIECNETVTKPIQNRKKTVTPETETETETETDNNTVENQKIFNGSVGDIFTFWKETLNHPKAKLDDKRKNKIKAMLKLGYTEHDIKTAIMGCAISPHHQGQNDRKTKYDDIELICRDAKHVDSFIKIATEKNIRSALTSKGMKNKAVLESWLEDSE